jgi:hypothetical protein
MLAMDAPFQLSIATIDNRYAFGWKLLALHNLIEDDLQRSNIQDRPCWRGRPPGHRHVAATGEAPFRDLESLGKQTFIGVVVEILQDDEAIAVGVSCASEDSFYEMLGEQARPVRCGCIFRQLAASTTRQHKTSSTGKPGSQAPTFKRTAVATV